MELSGSFRLLHAILHNFTHFRSELCLEQHAWKIHFPLSVTISLQERESRRHSAGHCVTGQTVCYVLISLLIKATDWESMNCVLCLSEKQIDFRDVRRFDKQWIRICVEMHCVAFMQRNPDDLYIITYINILLNLFTMNQETHINIECVAYLIRK